MRDDPLERLIEDALVDSLPDGLVRALQDGIARGCTWEGVEAILHRQCAGPLLYRGCQIVCERALLRRVARARGKK